MQKLLFSLAPACCLAALLCVPAHAANFVAYASPNSIPGNDCLTPATPCREIFQAIDKVDAGGTIHVAPGDYGAFGVDESMNIISDEGPAIVGNSTLTDATAIRIDVNANEKVLLRGFVANAGSNAITIKGAGTARLENCTFISSFSLHGINYVPTGASELYVSNTSLSVRPGTTGGANLLIRPSGSASVKVVLDGVRVLDSVTGILIDGNSTTGSSAVTVRNSTVAGGSANGLNATNSSGGATTVMIDGSTFSSNASNGVVASGAGVTVRMRDSTVTANARGLLAAAGGKLISGGGNIVAGNTVDGAFTSTIVQK